MELDGAVDRCSEAVDRCSEAVDQLAEAISQVGVAIREMLLRVGEMLSAVCKQWLGNVDFSSLAELVERLKLEEQRREEDRQKASELKLVSPRVVRLSRSKRAKVRKKNMARIRKELKQYGKRR